MALAKPRINLACRASGVANLNVVSCHHSDPLNLLTIGIAVEHQFELHDD